MVVYLWIDLAAVWCETIALAFGDLIHPHLAATHGEMGHENALHRCTVTLMRAAGKDGFKEARSFFCCLGSKETRIGFAKLDRDIQQNRCV